MAQTDLFEVHALAAAIDSGDHGNVFVIGNVCVVAHELLNSQFLCSQHSADVFDEISLISTDAAAAYLQRMTSSLDGDNAVLSDHLYVDSE